MKRIVVILLLSLPFLSNAQIKLFGNGGYNVNSHVFYLINGTDTIASFRPDSVKIYKPSNLLNFGNGNLRFTSDRTHSGAGYSLLLDSTSSMNLITRGIAFPSFLKKFSTLHMDGEASADATNHASFSTVYMNAANTLDSIVMQYSNNSAFGASIRYKNVSANQHAYVQVFKQRAVVSSDSVYISAIPAASADSVFGPLGYDAASKSRPVGVVPVLKYLKGSTTWQPGSVAAGSSATTNITVTGAALGDPVTVSKASGAYSNGEVYDAFVSATNTVTIRVHNVSTGSANYNTTETYKVVVLRY